ncbi:flagellar basal body-associated protein FliL [mine drainage metagenome]|uniref:Flagellar basal body-associated protein FliL n=1 Tax=mine drainage metagenome TaxID=410659 RepID=A0A1J5TY90_9ZZZZ
MGVLPILLPQSIIFSAMPPKPEANPQAAAPAAAPAAEPAPRSPSKLGALVPVILVILLAPAASWAVAQYVILPRLEKKLGTYAAATNNNSVAVTTNDDLSSAPASDGKGSKGPAAAANTYEFTNIVVNLAGTMGTRYLKTSFLVTSKDPHLREIFIREKPKLIDVTINVLSSLTLADLEEAGSKNIIREKLVQSYNQALGRPIADQIYFSDFVVQ